MKKEFITSLTRVEPKKKCLRRKNYNQNRDDEYNNAFTSAEKKRTDVKD